MSFNAPLVRDTHNLKILVMSTPKTGNTWVKHLLAAVYDLPVVDLDAPFDEAQAHALGERWVGHQHFLPDSKVLKWASQNQVVFVTTVRHPGDVLVSLYHYVCNYHKIDGHDFGYSAELFQADHGQIGANTINYVERFFFVVLNVSIAWLSSGRTHRVRYEDLWWDPIATLTNLTAQIHLASEDSIERAVEQSNLQMLRSLHGSNARFYRQGNVGHWRRELPPSLLDIFRRQSPYPEQFATLGYSLDPADALLDAPVKAHLSKNPFLHLHHFDNGVPVPPVVARLYLSFASAEARHRWPNVAATHAPDSFFAWLNTAVDDAPHQIENALLITNLSMRLYRERFDLRTQFPDIFGQERVDWVLWFVYHAQQEFGLDDAFIAPMRENLLAWASTLVAETRSTNEWPPLTQLADYIYHKRPDVQKAFPDLNHRDRIGYLLWFVQQGVLEFDLDSALTQPIQEGLVAWANTPDLRDPLRDRSAPVISQFAAYVHQTRPDLARKFPDIYGKDRLDYCMILVNEYSWCPDLLRLVFATWGRNARRLSTEA